MGSLVALALFIPILAQSQGIPTGRRVSQWNAKYFLRSPLADDNAAADDGEHHHRNHHHYYRRKGVATDSCFIYVCVIRSV